MHCKKCGSEVADGVKFCGACGAMVEIVEAAAEPVAEAVENTVAEEEKVKKPLLYRFNEFLSKLTGGAVDMKKRVGTCDTKEIERQSVSLAWKYVALVGLIALILVFWFVPNLTLEAETRGYYFIKTGDDEVSISIGGLGALLVDLSDAGEDSEMAGIICIVLTVIFHVIPLLLCALINVMPLLRKRVTKRRRLIYPNMTALFCIVCYAVWCIFWVVSAQQETEFTISTSLTFGGVMLYILLFAWLVLSFGAAAHNRRIVKMIKAAEVAPESIPEAPDMQAWK